MAREASQSGSEKHGQPLDDCSFDIMTQTEKKADFLHSAVDKYIRGAEAANRQGLVDVWNTIKQDEQRHLDMLKKELEKDVREGRMS
jgi:rubrerythrin